MQKQRFPVELFKVRYPSAFIIMQIELSSSRDNIAGISINPFEYFLCLNLLTIIAFIHYIGVYIKI